MTGVIPFLFLDDNDIIAMEAAEKYHRNCLRGFFMKNAVYFYYDKKKMSTVLVDRMGITHWIACHPSLILKQACLLHGTSYLGAKESFMHLTKAKKKVPVCVSVMQRIIFIPTCSEKSDDCCYLQFERIEKVRSCEEGCCVIFKDGFDITLPLSYRTIQRQMQRCRLFLDLVMDA